MQFDEMEDTMTRGARVWGDMTAGARMPYLPAKEKHIEQRARRIADARGALLAKIATLQADAERGL